MRSNNRRISITILFISLVIVMLGFGIAIPLMPFYITHFNASGSSLGLIMSLYSLVQFIFSPMWGRLSDRIGRKPVMLIGIFGYFVSFFLQGISQNILQLTLARVLAGLLSSATLPTAMAYVADTTDSEDRSKGVGLLGAAMGLGMIFGPMFGGVLTRVQVPLPKFLEALVQTTIDPSTGSPINLSIPFFVSALLALVATPVIYLMLPESHPSENRQEKSGPRQSQLAGLLNGLRGPVGFLYILAFLLAFALANMESVLALYGRSRFSMGPGDVGMLLGGMGVLSVVQQGIIIGPLTRKAGEVWIIKAGLLSGFLGFITLALAPTLAWLVAGALIFNVGSVLLQPSVTSLISKRVNSGQGEAMGINNSFQALGRTFGPLWAGFAYDLYSTLSFWTGAFILAAAFLYAFRVFSPDQAALEPSPAPGSQPES